MKLLKRVTDDVIIINKDIEIGAEEVAEVEAASSRKDLEEHKHEFGKYKGLNFLMRSWSTEYAFLRKCLTYYVYVPIELIPLTPDKENMHYMAKDRDRSKSITDPDCFIPQKIKDMYICDCIEDWGFHGGITWIKVYPTYVEIGCDYQHAWDNNDHKDLNHVRTDVYETIDKIVDWVIKNQKQLQA